jgi:exopolyphosphatase/guanosine-5'-triphosphate,3'-diphosphate pyrophosphatase
MVEYREAAHRLGAGQVAAIATAAFREVADGASLLEELKQALGVPVEVVSQETEGQLGFFTAGVACPDVPQDRMVVWDSGGGSFQMTSLYKGDILMYGHSTGSSLATKALVHDVQGHQYVGQSPNPVSLEEAFALRRLLTDRLPEPPVWLRAKVRRPDVTVLGIGGSTCIFNLAAQVVGRPEFTLEEVWAAAQSLANQTDAQLGWYPQRDMVISKLSLMAAVMAKCGVPRVRYCPCNGNTQGMLVYDRLWPA